MASRFSDNLCTPARLVLDYYYMLIYLLIHLCFYDAEMIQNGPKVA